MNQHLTTQHLLIAHGSPDPRHRETMQLVAKSLDVRGTHCDVAFLEHDEPRVDRWLAERGASKVVAIGMLLAPGYHATIDVPQLLGSAPEPVTVVDRGVLGAGRWLNATLRWLVADVGGTEETPVVLAVAGSTRPEAQDSLAAFADQWQKTRPGSVHLAAATGPGPSLEDVLTERHADGADPVVLPLMIAPGVLADRARKVAATRGFRTASTLAESPHFADAVASRLA